jgi:hypothetical protein
VIEALKDFPDNVIAIACHGHDSLRVHAKRHYDVAATTAYWRARMHKELMKALGG